MSPALGIIYDEPFATYLASDAVGSHKLEDLRPRPLIYFLKHVQKTLPKKAETGAFRFGRLFHCLALEGETEMEKRFVAVPHDAPADLRHFRNAKSKSQATVDSIAWWDKFYADAASKTIVAESDIALAWKMVRAVRAKPYAVELLSRGKPEVTFRAQLPGLTVQARVDWFDAEHNAGPMCINVKTVETLEDFDKQYENFAYYKGDALYRLIVARLLKVDVSVPQMVNLVVEKQAPHECAIRCPDDEALAIGTREVMADLRLLQSCYEKNEWPGEPNDARPVSLSEWKVRRDAA
jgi:hypothetical protein